MNWTRRRAKIAVAGIVVAVWAVYYGARRHQPSGGTGGAQKLSEPEGTAGGQRDVSAMDAEFPGTRQTVDDGAYDHLARGGTVPVIHLPATTGQPLDVVAGGRWTVLFLYPATGTPGQPPPDGWLRTPGAYGCTAESCGFRDLRAELDEAGAQVRGVSTQTPGEQAAFAAREHITYPLLSDHEHRLVQALDLPTFTAGGSPPRIRRATLLVDNDRQIREVLYPIPDPGGHAAEVVERLGRLDAGEG